MSVFAAGGVVSAIRPALVRDVPDDQ